MVLIKKILKDYCWLFVIGVIALLCGYIAYFYLDQKVISVASFVIGIFVIIFPFFQSRKESSFAADYETIVNDYKRKYEEELKKSENLKAQREKVLFEKTELKKFLGKVNETLQKENISKEELINSVSSPLKAIIFFKTSEDTSNKRALFLNNVYPDMGVKPIRSGLSILPPKRTPQNLASAKLINWFKKELKKRVPSDYEYNIPFMCVINLNEATSFKRLQAFRKIQLSYLDKIPIEELVPTYEIINYLKNKKHLSMKDILEVPNILFLVEDYLISKSDLEILKKKNNIIIEEIKRGVNAEELKTTDLAMVKKELLIEILKKHISEPDVVAERIKENAVFWKSYFEHRLKTHLEKNNS